MFSPDLNIKCFSFYIHLWLIYWPSLVLTFYKMVSGQDKILGYILKSKESTVKVIKISTSVVRPQIFLGLHTGVEENSGIIINKTSVFLLPYKMCSKCPLCPRTHHPLLRERELRIEDSMYIFHFSCKLLILMPQSLSSIGLLAYTFFCK